MNLKTIIIDDEQYALDKLQDYVKRTPFLQLVAACSGTTEALKYLQEEDIDVIFTDIEMPDIDGIRFIESLTNRPQVVFITAYRDFAIEGFRLSATDYLLKPYDMADFQRAANKVRDLYQKNLNLKEINTSTSDSIFIKVETRFERVELSSIKYIKGYGEYLQIFTEGRKTPLMTISSFSEILTKLNEHFIQVHRSYVVNMDKIQRVEKNRILFDEETIIPIGTTHRDAFINYLQSRSIGKVYKTGGGRN